MKPIKLYFAGAWSSGESSSAHEMRVGITNKLVSFLYPNQLESWSLASQGKEGNIIIDSGAFSAWNKGDVVNIDKYISYCHAALCDPKLKEKNIRVVNLDVIPGKKGETKKLTSSVKQEDKKLIDQAAEAGYENMMFFKENGITPIHVFHQGESMHWLDKMLKETDYIGISPANDVHQSQKLLWIDKTFSYLEKNNIKVDTHGFAVWSSTIILNYPWTSCDAASWRLVAAYGKIFYPVGGFKNADYFQIPLNVVCSEKTMREDLTPFGKELKELLREDGYDLEEIKKSWALRSEINIRYFLEFEKWANEKKQSMVFKPTGSFNLRG